MDILSLNEKKIYCEEVNEFIDNTEKYVRETCAYLNFDFDIIKQNVYSYITCPFNKAHRVPKKTIENHLKKCEWKMLGYTKHCIALSEPTLLLNNPSSIKFGTDEKLTPQTSDRFISVFTSAERKDMYEYVISNTVAPTIGQDITNIYEQEKTSEKITPVIELLAQERNLKRRRAKHRGVHTNKKSHTEILRELVQQQMEMLKESISEKVGTSLSDTNEESICYPDINVIKNQKKKKETEKDFKETVPKCNKKDLIASRQDKNYKEKHINGFNSTKELKHNVMFAQDNITNYKNLNHKTSDYQNSLKDKGSQNSLLNYDYYDNNHDKFHYNDIRSYQFETQYYNKNKTDCVNKNCNYVKSHHKYIRSKFNENKYNEKSRCDFKFKRNFKNMKHDKKNREGNYFHCKNVQKYCTSHCHNTYNKNQI